MPTSLIIVGTEVRKGLLITWSYRANLIMEFATIVFIFIGISYFMGRGELERENLPTTLLGYLVWFYAAIAINGMSGSLRDEAQSGTLEQMYMSPLPSWVILVGRVIATFMTSTAMAAIVGGILMLWLGISLPLTWQALPPFVLTMLGLFGFGYAFGGATLALKQVGALPNLVTNMMLFLNGALLPVHLLPSTLETIARLLPTTQGIIVIRKITFERDSLSSLWADGSLVYLTLHSAGFLIAG